MGRVEQEEEEEGEEEKEGKERRMKGRRKRRKGEKEIQNKKDLYIPTQMFSDPQSCYNCIALITNLIPSVLVLLYNSPTQVVCILCVHTASLAPFSTNPG